MTFVQRGGRLTALTATTALILGVMATSATASGTEGSAATGIDGPDTIETDEVHPGDLEPPSEPEGGSREVIVGETGSGDRTETEPQDISPQASGCTLAPGSGPGAQNCIRVNGVGVNVESSRSTYHQGSMPYQGNLCARHHEVQYTLSWSQQPSSDRRGPLGCIPPYVSSWVDWTSGQPVGNMRDGSTYCGRSANNHTSNVWSNWACLNIFH